ncbi:alpha/beta fold hydrolase [Aurantimonas sp. Leaf443]|uniref:alpha/beta fold hydrolase n=1 Tax=Aurantimonas sp. Leaf443 TaxID=1736378 RepID=UPI0006FB0AFF|nr:alpha/beta fold hydrolase [Aurantimonas sp. Leaf443]KQT83923.1 hypothetical protein ASG48_11070 [Aurantimonas sp. Leaf443]
MRLFLIPAFACDEALYESVVELLRADFDCAVFVAEAPTLRECADALLAEAGSGRFLVWGTSFGGHVAREVALAAPGRVAGLIVSGAGAAAPTDTAPFEARRAAIASGDPSLLLEEMARGVVFEPEGRGEAAADLFRAMAARAPLERLSAQNEALAGRPDRMADLAGLPVPTLLLWGAEDGFSPPAAAEAMRAAMPDARCVVIEDCGHLPSLESPMQCAAAIRRRFVAGA